MDIRPRRLRTSDAMRRLTRETRVSADALILPLFVVDGKNIKNPISSMDGHFHYSADLVCGAAEQALKSGVRNLLLFGLPSAKDECASGAYDENGAVQRALRELRSSFGPEIMLITDVCLCAYTSHGHCGCLDGGRVDNDRTLELLAKTAVSHAAAGADMAAPSDMMDGRVGAIRRALDGAGFTDTAIMSYAVKYASSFYGPFREAADCAPSQGDRKTYQMDFHNKREALKEALLDAGEGADILMVKPAMTYLDIIAAVKAETNLPLAAYSVSGEYAMIKAAGRQGLIDEYGVMCESALSVFRAGADILISYYACELAAAIEKGDIG